MRLTHMECFPLILLLLNMCNDATGFPDAFSSSQVTYGMFSARKKFVEGVESDYPDAESMYQYTQPMFPHREKDVSLLTLTFAFIGPYFKTASRAHFCVNHLSDRSTKVIFSGLTQFFLLIVSYNMLRSMYCTIQYIRMCHGILLDYNNNRNKHKR